MQNFRRELLDKIVWAPFTRGPCGAQAHARHDLLPRGPRGPEPEIHRVDPEIGSTLRLL
jgi:hypothetical protein